MAESQEPQTTQQEQQTEEIRTAQDLRLEELTKRLDSLEAENRELREANKGLWAAAHPAQAPAQPEHVKEGPSDVDILFKNLGVKQT